MIVLHRTTKDKIIIAQDFSDHPASRYKVDGDWSGEKFLEEILLPKFEKALEGSYILLIDLDGVFGYPSSFVSGSFGKLSIEKTANLLLSSISANALIYAWLIIRLSKA